MSRYTPPIILQAEGSECGIACLAMVSSYFGFEYDLSSLREKLSSSSKGVSLVDLIEMSNLIGLVARPLRIELDYIKQINTPCILHWGLMHYVVLVKTTKSKIIIHDPACGRRVLSYSEASKYLTGVVIEFRKSDKFKKEKKIRKFSWSNYLTNIENIFKPTLSIFLLAFVLELLMFSGPLFLQFSVDWAIATRDFELINILFYSFLVILLCLVASSYLRSWMVIYLGTKINLQWLSKLFSHIMKLPTEFFNKRNIGDISSRFDGINQIQRIMTSGFVEIVLDSIFSLLLLLVLFFYNSFLATITIVFFIISFLIKLIFITRIKQLINSFEISQAQQYGYFLESIRNIESFKIFSKENVRISGWENLLIKTQNSQIKFEQLSMKLRTFNLFFFGFERLLIIWQASILAMDNKISVGMLVGFMSFREMFSLRASNFLEKLQEIKSMEVHLDRLGDILFAKTDTEANYTNVRKISFDTIEVKDVYFRYSKFEPYILKGVSLKINKGDCIAITGTSGSGKSTLLRVLLGLLKPERGTILLDGVDINQFGILNYRKSIAAVLQEDGMLKGSISDNISFFDPLKDYEKLDLCTKAASIYDYIKSLPMSYNTLLNDVGSLFSSGQRQRMLLARALYSDPLVLFLDEASSHLDHETEKQVNAAILNLKMTRVMVAHRIETIKLASKVIKIENGVIKNH